MLVITKVSIGAFADALQVARAENDNIAAACCTVPELYDAIAEVYTDARPNELGRVQLRDFQSTFLSEHCKVRLVFQGNRAVGGYVVLDGELIALHCLVKGKGDWLIQHAVHDGATHLDCFDWPVLRSLYERHGFSVVRTEPNWEQGAPDVIYMHHNEDRTHDC